MDLHVFLSFSKQSWILWISWTTSTQLISIDVYFMLNKNGFVYISPYTWFVCISLFCQTHMDFYGFYGLFLLYGFLWTSTAQRLWIYTLWRPCMNFYGLLFCDKQTWICIYFYLFSNKHRFYDYFYAFMWTSILCQTHLDFYVFLYFAKKKYWISKDSMDVYFMAF